MDKVQEFISKNQHQFGYIMQEASRQWIQKDPKGALTVGPCNIFIQEDGGYHELQDRLEQQQQEIRQYKRALEHIRDYDAYSWSNDRQFIDSRIKEALGNKR
ncbi:hypothetical protein [Metabacillus fastidiosus]|uniref:Uncharacterized protein n=1 Tax=Metabacillus fastidiosus TaxID=1458 RepID=A0ABU6NTX6_9BACI|nr:hypothetical protein [Metabacillus fastidiosus]